MKKEFDQFFSKANDLVLGKDKEVRWVLISILSRGNLLLEDVPGVGKTTLVYLVSKLLGKKLTRIQFTNDVLPSDILGTIVFDQDKNEFYFRKGPLFGELILADELNRASPKTQSALLQSMEEKKITIEGEEHNLEEDFCVVATQNPYEQVGTFQLPESQIDRFFMGIFLGLPSREYEKKIVQTNDIRDLISNLDVEIPKDKQSEFYKSLNDVQVSDALLDYALDIMEFLRKLDDVPGQISPRAGKDLVLAAKTNAKLEGRDYVIPEDIKFVAPAVFAHRLGAYQGIKKGYDIINDAIERVAIP